MKKGLKIARTLAKAQNGSLQIDSEFGRGTKASFTIAVRQIHKSEPSEHVQGTEQARILSQLVRNSEISENTDPFTAG